MRHLSLIAVLALMTTVACEPRDRDDLDETGTPEAALTPGEGVAEGDANDVQEFVHEALDTELTGVRLSELAATRASNSQVKQFAKEMVTVHKKSHADLLQASGGAVATHDTTLHEDQLETLHRMSDLRGQAFDRAYIEAVIDEHEKAEDKLERWASNDDSDARPDVTPGEPTNTGVQQWVNTTLPVVRQHLERAREIQKAVGGKVTDRIDNPPDVRIPDDDRPDQDPDPEDRPAPASPTRP